MELQRESLREELEETRHYLRQYQKMFSALQNSERLYISNYEYYETKKIIKALRKLL